MVLGALPLLASLTTAQTTPPTTPPTTEPPLRASRYERAAPLPGLPAVTLDVVGNGYGVAQQTARARNLQARILWIDGTANLERLNSAVKIQNLVRRIKDVGFNTIVFDVKPIVGYTLYPSALTERLTKWKGVSFPTDFDPLQVMSIEAKRQGIPLYVSLNAFSEGHRMAKENMNDPNSPFGFKRPGPGYDRVEQQTVLYEPEPFLRAPFTGDRYPLMNLPGRLDRTGKAIGAITDVTRLPGVPNDAMAVVLDAGGTVLTTRGPGPLGVPGVPTGGSILVGFGPAAQFLAQHARPGVTFSFDSKPVFVPIQERPEQQIPLMMNPHDLRVQDRILAFVTEVLTKYDLKGVVFDDRLRFAGKNADFSELTQKLFEARVGRRINWPVDVFEFTFNPDLTRGIRPGRYYDQWMAFRAETLTDWVKRARTAVRNARPDAQLGVYAGSWFGEYAKFGSNYSSPDFSAGFDFLTEDYRRTGFAPELDFLITGCYYPTATIVDAMGRDRPTGRTVEAAGQLTNRTARDQTWAYAGIMLSDYARDPGGLKRALQAATGSTQGVMVFDLSHNIDQFWPIFQAAFRERKVAPHTVPGLLPRIRDLRARLDAMGVKEPSVAIREGAAGAGH